MKYFATMFNITRLKLANKRKHQKKQKNKKTKNYSEVVVRLCLKFS